MKKIIKVPALLSLVFLPAVTYGIVRSCDWPVIKFVLSRTFKLSFLHEIHRISSFSFRAEPGLILFHGFSMIRASGVSCPH